MRMDLRTRRRVARLRSPPAGRRREQRGRRARPACPSGASPISMPAPMRPRSRATWKRPPQQARRIKEAYHGKLAELGARRRGAGAGDRGVRAPRRADGPARVVRRALLCRRPVRSRKRAKFYGDISEKLTAISTDIIFFDLELNQIDDAAMAEALKNPRARPLQAVDRQRPQGEALPARGDDRAAVPREEPDVELGLGPPLQRDDDGAALPRRGREGAADARADARTCSPTRARRSARRRRKRSPRCSRTTSASLR